MALTVRDLTKLQCFQHLTLVSGKSGLENKVSGMGIHNPEYPYRIPCFQGIRYGYSGL